MSTLRARLDLEPADAVRFFEAKGEQLAWDYTDVWREAHVHAFTVAKATSLEVLRTIRAEVARAIGPGRTFEDFKRALRPRLQELGWWGTQEVLDADTGELTRVQLGSTRRLRTIFQTNVQTAYMAGRFKRFTDNAVDRPYWRYVAILDGRTRTAHAALHGKVWRHDDPIWKVIWPPNGWGCRCRVTALARQEFDELGVPLEDGRDAIVETQVVLNKAGDTTTVKGVRYRDENGKAMVFRPDPGWDYNPGEAWSLFDSKGAVPDCDWSGAISFADGGKICLSSIPGQKTWKDYGRPDLSAVPAAMRLPTPPMLAWSATREGATAMLADALGLSAVQPMRVVTTPVGDVVLRHEWLAHLVEKDSDKRERYGNFILPTLQSPFEVWLAEYQDGYRHRYIGLFEELGILVIVRLNKDGSLLWNMMKARDAYMNRQRTGLLLFGK